MIKVTFSLVLFVLAFSFSYGQSIDDLRDSINAQTVVFESNLIPNRDKDCSTEFGAYLFPSNLVSVNGGSSCAGNCHVPTNDFFPQDILQGSEGVIFMNDGFEICKYGPKDLKHDIVLDSLNTPTIVGLKYKKMFGHAGAATKEEQPTKKFGATIHQIDFEKMADVPLFKYYVNVCYGEIETKEVHFVQAIMDYQNSFEPKNRYVEWLGNGKSNRLIRKVVPVLWEDGCMNCHTGKGGVSDQKGQAVLNSSGHTATGEMVATRTWNNSFSNPFMFWNRSYVRRSVYGLSKHIEQESNREVNQSTGKKYTDKEVESIMKFVKKCLN